ncbi:addiction module toxin RelE [Klebsiella sp. P1CD1]|nr:addiction module toxin RelE [Klebsiella variicola]AYW22080.1 addiction module toxin RelE [Klebsiella sp. P1CD1]PJX56721.1 addiction module toxin RelE [Klebsiella sp. F-Nf9]PJX62315.1 addiction module toxin RelE [Klebsiella sp. E-Nf3]PKJ62604.1 addiction module toxin RelE [Klebsiella sp. T11]PKJ70755.1 addiction module toxin RelE [Klebsiella sp. X1-16S-Nf21]
MAAYSEVELILFIVQKAPWLAERLGPVHITERVARGRSPWLILND